MAGPEVQARPLAVERESSWHSEWRALPFWLFLIIGFLILMAVLIATTPVYRDAFRFVVPGLQLTATVTVLGYAAALVLGLLAGLGRITQNVVIRTIATTYVEFIRGVPTLVLIFTVAFVIVPPAAEALGLESAPSMTARGVAALAIIYGAFLAEIFRAGIESISRGQMEAARSLGMTYGQSMRYIILPQAVRNIAPALGNDFIAMLKDSSLLSVLAIRELTQRGRLHAGSTFRFRESYLVVTFLYLSLTIALSLLLRWYEGRIGKGRG